MKYCGGAGALFQEWPPSPALTPQLGFWGLLLRPRGYRLTMYAPWWRRQQLSRRGWGWQPSALARSNLEISTGSRDLCFKRSRLVSFNSCTSCCCRSFPKVVIVKSSTLERTLKELVWNRILDDLKKVIP